MQHSSRKAVRPVRNAEEKKTPSQIAHEIWQWIQILRNSTHQVTGPEVALQLIDQWAPPVIKLLQQLAGDLPSLKPLKPTPRPPLAPPSPQGISILGTAAEYVTKLQREGK